MITGLRIPSSLLGSALIRSQRIPKSGGQCGKESLSGTPRDSNASFSSRDGVGKPQC